MCILSGGVRSLDIERKLLHAVRATSWTIPRYRVAVKGGMSRIPKRLQMFAGRKISSIGPSLQFSKPTCIFHGLIMASMVRWPCYGTRAGSRKMPRFAKAQVLRNTSVNASGLT